MTVREILPTAVEPACAPRQGGGVRKVLHIKACGVSCDAMIKSFKSKETEEIFRHRPGKLRSDVQRAARQALRKLHRAKTVQGLGIPLSTPAEVDSSADTVLYNISVSDQCRICFEWRNGNAYNVEIVTSFGEIS